MRDQLKIGKLLTNDCLSSQAAIVKLARKGRTLGLGTLKRIQSVNPVTGKHPFPNAEKLLNHDQRAGNQVTEEGQ